ncbi:MAG: shikimate dehydrogenase [Paludibacter sp.]|nr:shikimate dehydrogenase [Paludibacter sp.]
MKYFGLIGFPLGHSFSKRFFTAKFENEHINAQYDLYELESIDKFKDLINGIRFSGLNVTIPYKQKVIAFLDELDDTAAKIGAVNVIKFDRSEDKLKLIGFNSDAIGFENSLLPLLKPHHRKALILGTGGASKAVDYVLNKNGIETMHVSRTAQEGRFTYTALNEQLLNEYTVIVNASPVGTYPHSDECPAIPYEYLSSKHLLYDVVYNPAETLFMKKGRGRGATVQNGEAMLQGQAVAAWEIWNR